MKLQIISSVHLAAGADVDAFNVTPGAPYLALLGDIGRLGRKTDPAYFYQMRELYARLVHKFRLVMLVPGVDEADGASWPDVCHAAAEIALYLTRAYPSAGRFLFLGRRGITVPDTEGTGAGPAVRILGAGLCSPAAPAAQRERDLAWLNDQVAAAESDPRVRSTVVLTHWPPPKDLRAVGPGCGRPADSRATFEAGLAAQPLWACGKLALWGFGRNCSNCDSLVARPGKPPVRMYSNQACGRRFDAEAVIEI